MTLQPAQTLLHKYRILRLLGEGGMGRVWLAEEIAFDGRLVAIKEVRRAGVAPSDFAEQDRRFRQEVELSARLVQAQAPYVVTAITAERDADDNLLLVMAYADGGSVADLLRAAPGGLPVQQAVTLTRQVCQALAVFHALPGEPVHRDVKPSNILLTRDGEARLSDFGLAQLAGASSGRSQLTAGQHPGTPLYMAPEQERGVGYLSPAADIYALGCVFFEMVTGKRYKNRAPGTPPSALNPAVPAWLDAAVLKALAEEPWNRHESAEDFAASLEAPVAVAPAARRRTWIGLVLILIAVVLISSVWLVVGLPQPAPTDHGALAQLTPAQLTPPLQNTGATQLAARPPSTTPPAPTQPAPTVASVTTMEVEHTPETAVAGALQSDSTPLPPTADSAVPVTATVSSDADVVIARSDADVVTATPSATPSLTPSATPTPDLEATALVEAARGVAAEAATLIAQPTPTTAQPTPTVTVTPEPPTATATHTPTATEAPTATPTDTPDAAATTTAAAQRLATSVAATLTALPTPTSTPTPTDTPTPTLTPTGTPDLAATATADAQRLATSVAATLTAMPTPTPSPTPTHTPTNTPDWTATAVMRAYAIQTAVAATLTAQPTPTNTPRPTATPTRRPTATPRPPTPTPITASGALRLAYVYGDVGRSDVRVADVDSGAVIAVADRSCDEAEPAWSPDGRYILYQSDCDDSYDIYRVNSDGGGRVRLTTTAQRDEREPSYAPDGSQIVYRVSPAGSGRNNDGELWIMDADGRNARPLGVSGRAPRWSPAGSALAFMSERDGSWEIYRYELASGATQRLTTCSANCRWPAWSPDGRQITYHSTTTASSATAETIWTMGADGSGARVLVTGENAGRPTWSADGYIAFNSNRGIEYVRADGTQRMTLLASSQNWAPTWSR